MRAPALVAGMLVILGTAEVVSRLGSMPAGSVLLQGSEGDDAGTLIRDLMLQQKMAQGLAKGSTSKVQGGTASLARQRQHALDEAADEDREENSRLSKAVDVNDVLGAINSLPAAGAGTKRGRSPAVAASASARISREQAVSPKKQRARSQSAAHVKGVRTSVDPTAAARTGGARFEGKKAPLEEDPMLEEEEEEMQHGNEEEEAQEEGQEGGEPEGDVVEEEDAPEVMRHKLGNRIYDMPRDFAGENQGDVHVPGDSLQRYMFRQTQAKKMDGGQHPQLWFFGEGPWAHIPTEGEMSGEGVGANHDGAHGIPVDRWFSEDAIVGNQPGLGDGSALGQGFDRFSQVDEKAAHPSTYFKAPDMQSLRWMRGKRSGRMVVAPVVSLADVPNVKKCIGAVCGDEVLAPFTDRREPDAALPASEVKPYFYASRRGQQMLAQQTGSFQLDPASSKAAHARGSTAKSKDESAAGLLKDLEGDVREAGSEVIKAASVTSPAGLWSAVWKKDGKGKAGTKLSKLSSSEGDDGKPSPTNRDNVNCIGKVCADETLDSVDNLHVPRGEVFQKGWSGWGTFDKEASDGREMLRSARPTYEDGGHVHRGESDVDANADMDSFFDRGGIPRE